MSRAVVYNGILHLCETPKDLKGGEDIFEQTRAVLNQIDDLLEKYGSSKEQVLTAVIYLKDISMWADYNTVWDEWVTPGNEPLRTTVEAALARDNLLIEVVVTAAV